MLCAVYPYKRGGCVVFWFWRLIVNLSSYNFIHSRSYMWNEMGGDREIERERTVLSSNRKEIRQRWKTWNCFAMNSNGAITETSFMRWRRRQRVSQFWFWNAHDIEWAELEKSLRWCTHQSRQLQRVHKATSYEYETSVHELAGR